MSFTTICPNCDARLTAPDAVRGKRWKCKKCGDPFTARRAADLDDEDDAPPRRSGSSRRSRDDDDEPRPRSRKQGAKKPSGSPVLLFVLFGVGALMLIGGGVLAVVYFTSSKKSGPVDQGPGQLPGQGASQKPISIADWVDYHDARDRFRLKLPTQPVIAEYNQHMPDGPIKHSSALCRRESISYFVAVRTLPPNSDPKEILARELDDFPVREPFNGTVESRKEASHQGKPGRELILSAAGDRGIMRLFVANDRLYLVLAWGMSLRSDNLEVAAVFQSLVFE
jgi:hypothetical protein